MHRLEPIAWESVLTSFRKIWGYTDFRFPQGEIVRCLLAHQDAVILMPTGGGKSICFQLPALLQTGTTLVVSPLVALMENQVQELRQRLGKRQSCVASLHSQLPSYVRRQTLTALEQGRLRLLYLSPETLLSEPVWSRLLQPSLVLNGLIFDECHCIGLWGDTFRPAYRRLGAVRPALMAAGKERFAIAAFTATADPQTQHTIQQVLQLQNPQIFQLNPYRSNLSLNIQTIWSPRGRRQRLRQFIQQRKHQSGLVYARTRRTTEELAETLTQQGLPTAAYHAGLSAEERREIEAKWLDGKLKYVCSTNAFGMGVNKADVRWVVHFHAPSLLSEYIQEVGRGGRDGKPTETLTLVSEPTGWLDPTDRERSHFFQSQWRSHQLSTRQLLPKLPKTGEAGAIARQFSEGAIALALLHGSGQLQWQDPFHYTLQPKRNAQFPSQDYAFRQMAEFLSTRECRWRFVLRSFGFVEEAEGMRCGVCDRCVKK